MEQMILFSVENDHHIPIVKAAQQAGVSIATIRNWIKTGYLFEEIKGQITLESFSRFQYEIAGKEKLTSRANKSLKDSHDHISLSKRYLKIISSKIKELELLGGEYESLLSDSHRNKEGIYYTPQHIVNDLFQVQDNNDLSSKTFCDPCCGSGNFVLRAIELGFKPENIFGMDTDPVAVSLTRKRVYEKTGYESDNFIEIDFLEMINKKEKYFYDYIYTNPPWGKKIDKRKKEFYGKCLNAGSSCDTCSLFFFACLKCLKTDGYLGLLLPESFFNISTFERARKRLLDSNLLRLIDYGKPFNGLVTKAQAIVLSNNNSKIHTNLIVCERNGIKYKRSLLSFSKNPKSIINLNCSPNDTDVINRVFSVPHITLKGQAKWGLGIVTGNNKKFIKHDYESGYMPVIKGSDIQYTGLKQPSSFIPKDLSLYQQVAPVDLFTAKEKLIYKFISSSLCFYNDTEKMYILNSANMLVLNENFPITGEQLCALLNSQVMNWLFKSIFYTHKILRGDLEYLPIHADYFKENAFFSESSYIKYLKLEQTDNGTYRIKI